RRPWPPDRRRGAAGKRAAGSLARVAIALGSNLGDRERQLHDAVAALRPFIQDLQVSAFHDTAPVGVAPQPRFLNAAVTGHTTLSPIDLLALLLDIERQFGRERPHWGAP